MSTIEIFLFTTLTFSGTMMMLIIQALIRTMYRLEIKNDYSWIELKQEKGWSSDRQLLYEMFFVDLFTCHECGKLTIHGTMCKDCREEYIKEEI